MSPCLFSRSAAMCLKNALAHASYTINNHENISSCYADIINNFCSSFLRVNITFVKLKNDREWQKDKELNNYFIVTSSVPLRDESLKQTSVSYKEQLIKKASRFYAMNEVATTKEYEADQELFKEIEKCAFDNIEWQERTIKNKIKFIEQILMHFNTYDKEIKLNKWPGPSIKFKVELATTMDGSEQIMIKQIDVVANDMSYCINECVLNYIVGNSIQSSSYWLRRGDLFKQFNSINSDRESSIFMDAFKFVLDLIEMKVTYRCEEVSVINYLQHTNTQAGNINALFSILSDIFVCLVHSINLFQDRNAYSIKCFAGADGHAINCEIHDGKLYENQPAVMFFSADENHKMIRRMLNKEIKSESEPVSGYFQMFILDTSLSKDTLPFFKFISSKINRKYIKEREIIKLTNRMANMDGNAVLKPECSDSPAPNTDSLNQSVNPKQD